MYPSPNIEKNYPYLRGSQKLIFLQLRTFELAAMRFFSSAGRWVHSADAFPDMPSCFRLKWKIAGLITILVRPDRKKSLKYKRAVSVKAAIFYLDIAGQLQGGEKTSHSLLKWRIHPAFAGKTPAAASRQRPCLKSEGTDVAVRSRRTKPRNQLELRSSSRYYWA